MRGTTLASVSRYLCRAATACASGPRRGAPRGPPRGHCSRSRPSAPNATPASAINPDRSVPLAAAIACKQRPRARGAGRALGRRSGRPPNIGRSTKAIVGSTVRMSAGACRRARTRPRRASEIGGGNRPSSNPPPPPPPGPSDRDTAVLAQCPGQTRGVTEQPRKEVQFRVALTARGVELLPRHELGRARAAAGRAQRQAQPQR
jgi:hypothetical protein